MVFPCGEALCCLVGGKDRVHGERHQRDESSLCTQIFYKNFAWGGVFII